MLSPLGFSSQRKWEQAKSYCIFRHTYNFHCVANFYVCSQVCVRVFIRQSIKQISLNQLDQGIRICDVVSLDFWPRNACEKLRHGGARIVLKSYPPWLIFSHDMCFRRTNFGFPLVWKCWRWFRWLSILQTWLCCPFLQSFSPSICVVSLASSFYSNSNGTKFPAEELPRIQEALNQAAINQVKTKKNPN